MTEEEIIVQNRKILLAILEKDIPLQVAVRDTAAKQATRIFVQGKNSQGSLIGKSGYNDNKPLYVNPNTSPGKGFKPEGKPFEFGKTKSGKTKTVRSTTRFIKKSGEEKASAVPHTTKWFPSYKDYRKTIGRGTEIVDLFLSGDLASDFKNNPGRNLFDKSVPRQIDTHEYHSGFARPLNALKAEGLSDKYNDNIFSLSEDEKKNFFTVAANEFKLAVANAQ